MAVSFKNESVDALQTSTKLSDVLVDIALGHVPTHHGVKCYFAFNCLQNDKCRLGSAGPMCERCISPREAIAHRQLNAYYMFGRLCLECPIVPFPCFYILLPLLIFILGFTVSGFSVSLCTKTKMLFYYLQLLVLTAPVQVAWPPKLLEVLSSLSFASLNSRMFLIECYRDSFNWYYAAWSISLAIPIVTGLILKTFIRMDLDKPDQKSFTNLRTTIIRKMIRRHATHISRAEALSEQGVRDLKIRRFVLMVLLLYYAPNCTSCLQTFSCSGSFSFVNMSLNGSVDVFFLDNRKSCIDLDFQVLNAIYLIVGLGMLLTPVVWIFIVRRHYKWNELNMRIRTFGPMYESYKATACHWDGVFMLRVVITTIATELFPFAATIQASVIFSMSVVYAIFLLLHFPYRKCCWTCFKWLNLHNTFEVFATISLVSLHFYAVLLSTGRSIDWFEWYLIGSIIFTVSFWMTIAVRIKSEEPIPEENITEYYQAGLIQICCCIPCKKVRVIAEPSNINMSPTQEIRDHWRYPGVSGDQPHRNENASPIPQESSEQQNNCNAQDNDGPYIVVSQPSAISTKRSTIPNEPWALSPKTAKTKRRRSRSRQRTKSSYSMEPSLPQVKVDGEDTVLEDMDKTSTTLL